MIGRAVFRFCITLLASSAFLGAANPTDFWGTLTCRLKNNDPKTDHPAVHQRVEIYGTGKDQILKICGCKTDSAGKLSKSACQCTFKEDENYQFRIPSVVPFYKVFKEGTFGTITYSVDTDGGVLNSSDPLSSTATYNLLFSPSPRKPSNLWYVAATFAIFTFVVLGLTLARLGGFLEVKVGGVQPFEREINDVHLKIIDAVKAKAAVTPLRTSIDSSVGAGANLPSVDKTDPYAAKEPASHESSPAIVETPPPSEPRGLVDDYNSVRASGDSDQAADSFRERYRCEYFSFVNEDEVRRDVQAVPQFIKYARGYFAGVPGEDRTWKLFPAFEKKFTDETFRNIFTNSESGTKIKRPAVVQDDGKFFTLVRKGEFAGGV